MDRLKGICAGDAGSVNVGCSQPVTPDSRLVGGKTDLPRTLPGRIVPFMHVSIPAGLKTLILVIVIIKCRLAIKRSPIVVGELRVNADAPVFCIHRIDAVRRIRIIWKLIILSRSASYIEGDLEFPIFPIWDGDAILAISGAASTMSCENRRADRKWESIITTLNRAGIFRQIIGYSSPLLLY